MEITRINFQQVRERYGLKIEDVAKKSGLSASTIWRFESGDSKWSSMAKVKGANGSTILHALQDLISKRNPKPDKKKLLANVKEYCTSNKISLNEFCKMCGFSSGNLYSRYPYVSDSVVDKIMSATGWTYDQLVNSIDDISNKEEDTMSYVASSKTKAIEEAKGMEFMMDKEFVPISLPEREIINKRYIFENGEYILEYDTVTHHRKTVSQQEFLDAVSGT